MFREHIVVALWNWLNPNSGFGFPIPIWKSICCTCSFRFFRSPTWTKKLIISLDNIPISNSLKSCRMIESQTEVYQSMWQRGVPPPADALWMKSLTGECGMPKQLDRLLALFVAATTATTASSKIASFPMSVVGVACRRTTSSKCRMHHTFGVWHCWLY